MGDSSKFGGRHVSRWSVGEFLWVCGKNSCNFVFIVHFSLLLLQEMCIANVEEVWLCLGDIWTWWWLFWFSNRILNPTSKPLYAF